MEYVTLEKQTAQRIGRATLAIEKLSPVTLAPRRGPRNLSPASATGALTADDLDRTCLDTKAINFSGREIPPGHWGWVEFDANELDLGGVYPVPDSLQVTAYNIDPADVPQVSSSDFAGGLRYALHAIDDPIEDGDFVVYNGQFTGSPSPGNDTDNGGTPNPFAYSISSSSLNSFYLTHTAFSGFPGSAQKAFWGTQFLDRDSIPIYKIPRAGTTGGFVSGRSMALMLRIRGAKRMGHLTFLDPDIKQSYVANGHTHFAWQTQRYTAPADTAPGAWDAWNDALYSAPNDNALTVGGEPTTGYTKAASEYLFPVGTRFLVRFSAIYDGSGSSYAARGSAESLTPSWNRVASQHWHGATVGYTEEFAQSFHLTPALTTPAVAPLSEVLDAFEDYTNFLTQPTGSEDIQYSLIVTPIFADPAATPSYPEPTCNPLILRDPPREAGFTAETAKAKSEARKVLDAARLWRPVLAKATIGDQSSGQVVWGGVSQGWIYRRNLTDRYAGMAPENTTRTEIYGTAIGDEVGRLGRYYKKPKQGGDDPRLACFFGRPDLLFSQSRCGPVEILKWGRDLAETNAITVTLNATRTTATATALTGTYTSYTLSTGAAVTFTPAQPWTVSIPQTDLLLLLDLIGGGALGNLTIDLGQDGGASPPLYGDEVANVLRGESTAGRFEWWLLYNRTLIVYPKLAPWQAVADGGSLSDTIVFAGSAGDPMYSSYAPWIFADPVDHTASFAALSPAATFADWPEAIPAAPGQVPTGSNLVADATYDPYFGRALGKDADGVDLSESDPLYETDQRLGLQLAVFRFLDHCPGGSGGGCC